MIAGGTTGQTRFCPEGSTEGDRSFLETNIGSLRARS